jgi:hypothetical protein
MLGAAPILNQVCTALLTAEQLPWHPRRGETVTSFLEGYRSSPVFSSPELCKKADRLLEEGRKPPLGCLPGLFLKIPRVVSEKQMFSAELRGTAF